MQILLQLRSWVPFQRIQNFRLHSYFNLCSSAIEVYYQDIILNEIASDESHYFVLVWKTSINFGNSLLWYHEFLDENLNFLKKMTPPMAFVMERSNYHWQEGPNSYVGRKLVTNYRNVTKLLRDESTLPWYYKTPVAQTLLLIDDDVERWLWERKVWNNSRRFEARWPETEMFTQSDNWTGRKVCQLLECFNLLLFFFQFSFKLLVKVEYFFCFFIT